MPYGPIAKEVLLPGIAGNDDAGFKAIMLNLIRLYGDTSVGGSYQPIIAAGSLLDNTVAPLEVTGTTPAVAARIQVPKNADNQKLAAVIRYNVDSGDTIRVALAYDSGAGAGTGTATTAAPGAALAAVTAAPTGSGHPREAYLTIAGAAGSDVVRIFSVVFYLYCDTVATATETSGVLGLPYTEMAAASRPITSERVQRMLNFPTKLAQDRPACLYSLLASEAVRSSTSMYQASSTTFATVARGYIEFPDSEPRTYRIAVYLSADAGTTPQAKVSWFGMSYVASSAGWNHSTFTVGPGFSGELKVLLRRSAGSGRAYVNTVQIFREP